MVNYMCQRCGYTTNRKSNLKNHFKRKKICPPILKDYNIKKLCKIGGFKIYNKGRIVLFISLILILNNNYIGCI